MAMQTKGQICRAIYSILQECPIDFFLQCAGEVCHDIAAEQKKKHSKDTAIIAVWGCLGDELQKLGT